MRASVWMPGGVRTEVHLTGEDTGGAFCLLVDEPTPGWSLPAHRHRNEAETIHVVSGTFWMEVDGRRLRLEAGAPAPGAETRRAAALEAATRHGWEFVTR